MRKKQQKLASLSITGDSGNSSLPLLKGTCYSTNPAAEQVVCVAIRRYLTAAVAGCEDCSHTRQTPAVPQSHDTVEKSCDRHVRDNLGSEGGLSLLTQLFLSVQQLVLDHIKSMVAGLAALTGVLQQSGGRG